MLLCHVFIMDIYVESDSATSKQLRKEFSKIGPCTVEECKDNGSVYSIIQYKDPEHTKTAVSSSWPYPVTAKKPRNRSRSPRTEDVDDKLGDAIREEIRKEVVSQLRGKNELMEELQVSEEYLTELVEEKIREELQRITQ